MLATAVAFGLLSKVAEFFSESYGASFVFPPAGLSLAASVAFGGWGVLGVLAGAVATPWGAAAISPFAVVLFSLVHASAAVIRQRCCADRRTDRPAAAAWRSTASCWRAGERHLVLCRSPGSDG
jgi:hypothetical protein